MPRVRPSRPAWLRADRPLCSVCPNTCSDSSAGATTREVARARARVDPGLTRCGLGVVEGGPAAAAMVAVGVVRTPHDRDAGERLLALADRDRRVAGPARARRRRHRAGLRRRQRRRGHGHRAGVRRRDARRRAAAACRVALHTPTEVKAAVTGSGRADKAQVTAMVTRLLGLDVAPKPGRRRRRPGPGHLPRLARWRRRPGCSAAVAAQSAQAGRADDRLGPRDRPRGRPRLGRRRGRRRRHARAHDARARPPACAAGTRPRLATTLVVREDSLTLYGFADDDERDMFETVQTVSGVGPAARPGDARGARARRRCAWRVSTGDLVALTKVPGIGKKGAERIVLELRDKIGVPSGAPAARRGRRGRRPRRGAGRSARRWSAWAGRPSRPRTPSSRVAPDGRPTAADVSGAAAGRPAGAGPVSADGSTAATSRRVCDDGSLDATARVVDAGGDDDERQVEAALRPKRLERVPRPDPGARPAAAWCSRRPSAAARRPTTCCCPGRPGWARPPWR